MPVGSQIIPKQRVEFATRRKQFEQAFQLVYREYLKKGYCLANASELRISFFNALPETVTFCLWREETLIATATLIPDSPMGLPMEEVYPKEIRDLRAKGRKLCEVSLLALNSDVISNGILPIYFAERLRCLYHIFKPILWYARKSIEHSDLCIAVNPVHRFLYSSLYFEQFGDEKVYESVRGNPSIAMRLNFDELEARAKSKTPGLYKLFLAKTLEIPRISQRFRWSQEEFAYFFVERLDILRKATPVQIDYLALAYPELSIRKMLYEASGPTGNGKTAVKKTQ